MAVVTEYVKTISTDFLNGKVNSSKLTTEINGSSIITALDHIDTAGDSCSIWFKDVLSAGDQTTLTSVVNSHTGTTTSSSIQQVTISEESGNTGGHFASKTVKVTAAANSSSSIDFCWPFPITALAIKFVTTIDQVDDTIDLFVGGDTTIGTISSNISTLAPAWTASNYVVGQKVTYTHAVFGSRVYTCIINTVSNETPADTIYWRHGFEIPVSSTVIDLTKLGFYITLDDGTNTDVLDRVVYKTTTTIFTEKAPVNTYLSATPTSIKQTVYSLKDYEVGHASLHDIGDSKIGGSYVPADTMIRVTYNNNFTNQQDLIGSVEFLY